MNVFIVTCKIISQPRLLRYKKKPLTTVIVLLYNNKTDKPLYHVTASARGKLGAELFHLYKQGDLVIVEGTIEIKKEKIYLNSSYPKNVKTINLKIITIHPTHHILEFKT
uniref:Putative single-stranded DNA binding protein n=1 Tax=Caulacanthus okamurae TaxID=152008 RepID=A0A6H1U8E6_9FLOR|nr:putative single-stranded DNA binding protein [Caulacanthus okamurae]QIZ74716.1 putative single-stranded DNA binding protein [Caulacanthus okamurae]